MRETHRHRHPSFSYTVGRADRFRLTFALLRTWAALDRQLAQIGEVTP